MTTTNSILKGQVAVVLAEAKSRVLNKFFNSEMESEYSSRYPDADHDSFLDALKVNNITFKHVTCFGGEEQGKEYWSVYEFTDGTSKVFVKFDGWYASYNGSEYEEFYFVEPVSTQVIVYNKTKG